MRSHAARTHRRRAVAVAIAVALSLVAAACTSHDKSGAPGAEPPPPRAKTATSAGGELNVAVDDTRPGTVLVSVRAPADAKEMQLGIDASFSGTPWQPVTATAALAVHDTGYVEVFARFRSGPDAKPGARAVAGVVVDPTWAAAVASADGGGHQAESVGLAAPDVLAVRVASGRVVIGGLQADGTREYDTDAGAKLDTKVLDKAASYQITSADDAAYTKAQRPKTVVRVTRPDGLAVTGPDQGATASPVLHDLFLHLPKALVAGASYTVTVADGAIEPITFRFDPRAGRSPSVHANQLGFRPGDALKVAYVSAWEGVAGGIALPSRLGFEVIDTGSGATVVSGQATPRAVGASEWGKGDLTGAPVYELDFSSLRTPGTYRVCVGVIGCSYDFVVSETATWLRATVAVARAMYHQRSGTGLGPPYTAVTRPVAFGADRATGVQQSTQTLMENPNGLGEGEEFAQLTKTTGATVSGAWGGHFDAGDWDRRIQHLWYLRAALDLVTQYPARFATLDLNIPESDNKIPDLVDEGLWDLDLYLRMQQPDGGIRGGINGADGAPASLSSWTQGQTLYAYAADPWSSYIYAGVAAETARVLAAYDPARAATYGTSALAAMTWAEAQPVPAAYKDAVTKQRGVAAAALFALTGADTWQDVFVAATPFGAGPVDLLGCHGHDLCDAAWIFARIERTNVKANVKANVRESLRRNAATLADLADTTRFGWTIEHPQIPLIWGLGPATPKTMGLLRGFAVTGDRRDCTAALRSATFSVGANPLDTVFVTGLGQRNVRSPLVVDVSIGGLPLWSGIPVYGMHQLGRPDDAWIARYFLRPAGARPDPEGVPYLQMWWDLPNVAPLNEFTAYQSLTEALSSFGALAAVSC